MANYHLSSKHYANEDKHKNSFAVIAAVGIVLLAIICGLAYSYIDKAHQLEQTVQKYQESQLVPTEETQLNQGVTSQTRQVTP